VGPQTRNVVSLSMEKDAWLPVGLTGADVIGAWDGSCSHICFIWLSLATKSSHAGFGVVSVSITQRS
jgi:hypothetical protein